MYIMMYEVNTPLEQSGTATRGGLAGDARAVMTLLWIDGSPGDLELKIRLLRAEVLETMLCGCVTWSPRACHYDTLR